MSSRWTPTEVLAEFALTLTAGLTAPLKAGEDEMSAMTPKEEVLLLHALE